ncbi:unnamed protein product [Adineta ricciae]|uniref:F-box domain-containing protein n=1 Tax=Adineta ricciae TaxID=249248 RepID=A0A813W2R8_ADIRI|nr:unnamed protein product [Adineta ricciae]CAF0844876.1 unnamed protein product [Adineta ricciae]
MNPAAHSNFESLSNELLLEVFEYLDAYDLYLTFHALNQRINALLRRANLHILLESSKNDENVLNGILSFFTPSQVRVLSLNIDNTTLAKQFVSFTDQNLYSLNIYKRHGNALFEIIPCLSRSSRIKYLRIDEAFVYGVSSTRSLFDLIFIEYSAYFTSLVVASISFHYYTKASRVQTVFPHLRHLSLAKITLTSTLTDFLSSSTPNLRSLVILPTIQDYLSPTFALKQIRQLHLRCTYNFEYVASLIKIFPSLRRLKIDYVNYSRNLPSTNPICKSLTEENLPHLKQLTIDFEPAVELEIVKSFTTNEFWSAKKLNVIRTMNKMESRCPMVKSIYFGSRLHSLIEKRFI